MSNEEKQIEELKKEYKFNSNIEIRKKIIDNLTTYGNRGIDTIYELMKVTGNNDFVSYCLDQIKKNRPS